MSKFFKKRKKGTYKCVGSLSSSQTDRPTISLRVNNSNNVLTFLIDTGSDVSLIAHRHVSDEPLEHVSCNLTSISGSSIPILGKLKLHISDDNDSYQCSCLVTNWSSKINIDGVIGWDFLQQNLHLIDKWLKPSCESSNSFNYSCEKSELVNSFSDNETIPVECSPVNNDDTMPTIPIKYNNIVMQYSNLFTSKLKKSTLGTHHITLKSSNPIRTPPRRLPLHYQDAVQRMIEDYEKQGLIVRSNSPYCSPVVMVPKGETDKLRMCCDYRRINEITIKDSSPIPTFEEIRDSLQGSKVFSKFDLRSGYWQMALSPEAQRITAFSPGPQYGLWEWTVMPFGVVNGPSSFQRAMTIVFQDMPFVVIYFDDVYVHSQDPNDHPEHLRKFLERCDQYSLSLNGEKTVIGANEIEVLGHIIGNDEVKMSPSKLETIRNWPRPSNKKQLMSFLGLCNYDSRFIANYSSYVSVLYKLTETKANFIWTNECEMAFVYLKEQFEANVCLKLPNADEPFGVYTDASNSAVSGVLIQNGKPVEFCSRVLSKSERNYSTIQKECLAIVFTLKKFRHYLLGSQFKLYTDHKPLIWLKEQRLEGMLGRWILAIQEYSFDINHVPGIENILADAVSRQFVDALTSEPLIKDDELVVRQNEDRIISIVKTSLQNGENSIKIPESKYLEKRWNQIRPQLVIENNMLVRKTKLSPFDSVRTFRVIPDSMIPNVIKCYHDTITCGHLGIEKTLARIQSYVYWPGMRKDIMDYISKCESCLSVKVVPKKTPLDRFTTASTAPGQLVTSDILKLPPDQGYNAILLIVDAYSKYPVAYKLRNEQTPGLYKHFISYFTEFGIPDVLLTDQGTNFESNLISHMCKYFGVTKDRTTPYHPECDGQTERMNRSLLEMLRHYASENNKWVNNLDCLLMAYRTSQNTTTGQTPALLFFGREIKERPVFDDNAPDLPTMSQWAEILDAVDLKKSRITYEESEPPSGIECGDTVLVRRHVRSKLQPTFDLNWKVIQVYNKCVKVEKDNIIKTVNFDNIALQKKGGGV